MLHPSAIESDACESGVGVAGSAPGATAFHCWLHFANIQILPYLPLSLPYRKNEFGRRLHQGEMPGLHARQVSIGSTHMTSCWNVSIKREASLLRWLLYSTPSQIGHTLLSGSPTRICCANTAAPKVLEERS